MPRDQSLSGEPLLRAPFGFAPALIALAIGGFTIGTTEFATMGVLPELAHGLHVSEPTAGHVISAYALGVVIGVPIFALVAAHLPRKGLLLALMGAYAAFNLLSAVANSFGMLFVARLLDGLPHGAYFGVASIVASQLSRPEHRGRAIAMVMFGLSVANVVGVPFDTWLGQHAGWRSAYLVSAGLAALTVLAVWIAIPRMAAEHQASGAQEAKSFFGSPQVWLTMIVGTLVNGGLFATYSYIDTTVTSVTHLAAHWAPFFVLAYGLGMTVGTPIAGELARWGVFKALLLGGSGSIVVMLLFWLTAPHAWFFWPVIFCSTALNAIITTNLQIRLMDVAGSAVTLGAAMNHAALNISNALGAYLGGVVIAFGWGYRAPALVGAVLAVLGTSILVVSGTLHRNSLRGGPEGLTPTFPTEEHL